MKVTVNEFYTDTLSCEPILRRTNDGGLLCLCQCDGPWEPHAENRVYAFRSYDNGATWSPRASVYPEDGRAVYCTEVSVFGDEVRAFLTLHDGHFLDWECRVMLSRDGGRSWVDDGQPTIPTYAFIRGAITLKSGRILYAYQSYPLTDDAIADIRTPKTCVWNTDAKYCESGVLIGDRPDGEFRRVAACRMSTAENWVWSEPTLTELEPGHIVMLMRYNGTGRLWRCDSFDGGETWSDCTATDIPNPSNKPKLIPLDGGRVALLHTPSENGRFPLEMWISGDRLNTWESKTTLSQRPGEYSYSDGIYEDGHVRFTIELDRKSILFYDIEL